MSQAAAADKARAPASASAPAAAPDLRSSELDPLLQDLSEKKQSFRRGVVSLAAELKDARGRLASQEASFAKEILSRQVAEKRAKTVEEEICRLQRSLEEKDVRLQASTSSAEQYLKDLENLKDELSVAQAAAEASALSAQSAETQCLFLLKELEEKNSCLKEHEEQVNKLIEQLDILQKDLQSRELSQNQLKDEVTRIEREIMEAVARVGTDKNNELLKILEEVSPKNLHNLNKHLTAKDVEIARLKDEIGFISAHWKHKTKELESQLEKHRRADQELKKRVLKLEFCLQETRARTRKLQRMGEKREKVLKELREQLTMKERAGNRSQGNPNFWESSGFKLIVSMSMLVLVVFAKR